MEIHLRSDTSFVTSLSYLQIQVFVLVRQEDLSGNTVRCVRGKDEKVKLCEISLSEEMTKNRKPRIVQGLRGDVLERIRKYSKYTQPNDYVFVDNNSGNELGRDYYYRAWKFMLKNTGLDMSLKEITYYNLRHSCMQLGGYTLMK